MMYTVVSMKASNIGSRWDVRKVLFNPRWRTVANAVAPSPLSSTDLNQYVREGDHEKTYVEFQVISAQLVFETQAPSCVASTAWPALIPYRSVVMQCLDFLMRSIYGKC